MTTTCPLCGRNCGSHDIVRRHLHVDHRKSGIIDSYVADGPSGDGRLVVESE